MKLKLKMKKKKKILKNTNNQLISKKKEKNQL